LCAQLAYSTKKCSRTQLAFLAGGLQESSQTHIKSQTCANQVRPSCTQRTLLRRSVQSGMHLPLLPCIYLSLASRPASECPKHVSGQETRTSQSPLVLLEFHPAPCHVCHIALCCPRRSALAFLKSAL